MLTRHPKGVISLILSSPSLSVSRWHADCRRLISEMKEKYRKIIMDSEASGKFNSAAYRLAMFAFYRKHLCRLTLWPACVIKTPALFTCGRYDEASPETTEYFHRMMPGSE